MVQDGQFLLSGFRLTTLKDVTEGSKAIWKMGGRLYPAPECEDMDNGFKPREVGRKSDIRSFGCVLVGLVTYIMRVSEGVKAFEQSRKVTLDGR